MYVVQAELEVFKVLDVFRLGVCLDVERVPRDVVMIAAAVDRTGKVGG